MKQSYRVSLLQMGYVDSLIHCHCSFSVPFDEDDRDDSVWFLDHDYLENMYGMFKKVNGEEVLMSMKINC